MRKVQVFEMSDAIKEILITDDFYKICRGRQCKDCTFKPLKNYWEESNQACPEIYDFLKEHIKIVEINITPFEGEEGD